MIQTKKTIFYGLARSEVKKLSLQAKCARIARRTSTARRPEDRGKGPPTNDYTCREAPPDLTLFLIARRPMLQSLVATLNALVDSGSHNFQDLCQKDLPGKALFIVVIRRIRIVFGKEGQNISHDSAHEFFNVSDEECLIFRRVTPGKKYWSTLCGISNAIFHVTGKCAHQNILNYRKPFFSRTILYTYKYVRV